MRYTFIKEQLQLSQEQVQSREQVKSSDWPRRFSLAALCRAMKVSQSGYRAWSMRIPSARSLDNEKLTEQICNLFEQKRQTYGSVRLTDDLHDLGVEVSKNRVARLMRAAGLKVGPSKRLPSPQIAIMPFLCLKTS